MDLQRESRPALASRRSTYLTKVAWSVQHIAWRHSSRCKAGHRGSGRAHLEFPVLRLPADLRLHIKANLHKQFCSDYSAERHAAICALQTEVHRQGQRQLFCCLGPGDWGVSLGNLRRVEGKCVGFKKRSNLEDEWLAIAEARHQLLNCRFNLH